MVFYIICLMLFALKNNLHLDNNHLDLLDERNVLLLSWIRCRFGFGFHGKLFYRPLVLVFDWPNLVIMKRQFCDNTELRMMHFLIHWIQIQLSVVQG